VPFSCVQARGANTIRLIRGSGVDVNIYSPRKHLWGRLYPPDLRMVGDKGVRNSFGSPPGQVRWPQARFQLAGPLYPGNPSALSAGNSTQPRRKGVIEWLGYREDIPKLHRPAHRFLPCLVSRGTAQIAPRSRSLRGANHYDRHQRCKES